MTTKQNVMFCILIMAAATGVFAEDDPKNCSSISSVSVETPIIEPRSWVSLNATPCESDGNRSIFELPESTATPTDDDSSEESSKAVPSTWSWYPIQWTWNAILQLTSATVGVVGNLMVISVIFGRISSSRSTDILVGNLALVDLVTSVFMIPTPVVHSVPVTWSGYLYCVIVELDTPMWTTITMSTYTLVAISFDRYCAIVHPLRFKRLITRGRVIKCVALMWVFISLLSVIDFFIHGVNATGSCGLGFSSESARVAFACYLLCLRLFVPVLLLLITQMSIARALRQQSKRFAQDSHSRPSVHLAARGRVISMMLLVIVVFVLCWTPVQVMFFCLNLEFISRSLYRGPLHLSFIILAFFNSCLNPFIYTARNPQFRKALIDLFTCAKRGRGPVFEHDEIVEDKDTTDTHTA